ncbi:MAG: peptidoglycan editing factor PgeF [Oscillospiraceae bacterium]|nr:peptidoglycan editing factor PgeF [Oscillospiraceae bacterium]
MAFTLTEKEGFSWVTSGTLPAKHLFTRRLSGVGEYPYFSNPDPQGEEREVWERVRALWRRFRDAGGFPAEGFCFTHQVHGTLVRRVTAAERRMPPLTPFPPDCDGLITDEPGVPLCVFTADCVPVLFHEPRAGIVCAVHSGWRGTAKDMMGAAVAAVTGLGGRAEDLHAAIGPCISRCCFETGPEVKEAVEALLGADAEGLCPPEEGVPGKYMVDLKETNRRRLLQLGVPAGNIDVSPDCTMSMSDVYWSHRATGGVRGTMASVIML